MWCWCVTQGHVAPRYPPWDIGAIHCYCCSSSFVRPRAILSYASPAPTAAFSDRCYPCAPPSPLLPSFPPGTATVGLNRYRLCTSKSVAWISLSSPGYSFDAYRVCGSSLALNGMYMLGM
uniref:Uncharacterized protein n=1 Tax=Lygus hesperus TaxID=30085 RepID=A0A146LCV7_LYGHE